ncbi:hypothetical protein PCASD_21589 [Puccinia coronata f. sp. avenae]|uniref:No apical meristem-associated C-terminal domain-containing protein n=1 Tax=Puccinia coronata f. sp. avenae TaxID=200324 RepID=A0A2N5SWD1_9BASI|nr:hypothetical protein PCASD_21589 [Puccinia coronata f. sp. avenae]
MLPASKQGVWFLKATLKFAAIYDKLKDNPASGSAPEDWLTTARQFYFNQEGRQFAFERPWLLLKTVSKWQSLSGKAKKLVPPLNNLQGSVLLEDAPPNPNTTASKIPDKAKWERPAGVHAAKQNAAKDNYKKKRLNLLESSTKEATQRLFEAKQSNDIQELLVENEQEKVRLNILMQDPDKCPDATSHMALVACKKQIHDEIMAQQDKHAPTPQCPFSNEHTATPGEEENVECNDEVELTQDNSHICPDLAFL